ncbi:M20/M25/M40 family metallo-hydrolase [Xanthobacter tagetidis]|uniref:M20/M25/M40 family metallo-hydrolase n=1 Tax=Xanthobacter tagetidis TaxID=60216 RepID=A0A3L7ACY6_9HYPH|nr:M20/M25/M40 family metallo-hydrolase [Xanthobacter tagetidis]MBB6306115.1 acetylornithine deacetylase/succinyl-diaminopimelate desuccinylase-like protein [Xanthobacter tagetidis]RLP77670.1 M20/M25/M40 family metallo-hydrolase [Xanthobacter tagetidis]
MTAAVPTPASLRQDILAFVDGAQAAETAFLAELVKVPSDNPPGDCAPHAERAAALLEALGFTVERHRVPQARVRAGGMESVTNLVIRERFGDGPVVALNAHGDVVPPGLGWSVDPYGAEVRDGVMYGRGVAVSKSDFATYAYALLALKAAARAGARFAGTIELHFTYDEEIGGLLGPGWLLEEGITKPDYVVSAGFAYDIVTAHNGCLHLEAEIIGRSAHAAMPDTGADALEAATAVLAALYRLRHRLKAQPSAVPGIGAPGLTVGLISGGINTNVVPDKVSLRIDRRITPEEDAGAAEAQLHEAITDAVAGLPGISCRLTRILIATPFVPMPGQERLVGAIRKAAEGIMPEPVGTKGVPIYTDARLYSAAGIPTVLYGAGPRTLLEANGHRADEKLKLDDLHKATKVVALALADLLAPA